jgi:thiol-disulfide isomerase/thioredoxin
VSKGRRIAVWATVAVVSVAGGIGYHLLREAETQRARAVVERIYATRLADLNGSLQHVGQWRGHVLVVNFWATWCAPCREEIPGVVRLQDSHGARGLTFVGIAIDQPEKVVQFAQEFRMNYPVLVGGLGALDLLREAGNRAGVLPYTVVIDRHGGLISQRTGGVNLKDLETMIQPLL